MIDSPAALQHKSRRVARHRQQPPQPSSKHAVTAVVRLRVLTHGIKRGRQQTRLTQRGRDRHVCVQHSTPQLGWQQARVAVLKHAQYPNMRVSCATNVLGLSPPLVFRC